MAIIGNLETLKKQIDLKKFHTAISYLEKVLTVNSLEQERLLSYGIDAFERVELDEHNFALEQVYNSKERTSCFFESHQKYIDVQFILEGEEIIELADITTLAVDMPYSSEMDLLKYKDTSLSSKILLQKGDIAIFFAEDAHMPCVKTATSLKVIKTVVKVAV